MKKALLVIDYVNDFVADDGALTCGKVAQDIDAYLSELIDDFAIKGQYVVVACDCHDKEDTLNPEGKLFPPHCIAGTCGAALYGETKKQLGKVPNSCLLHIKKTRYSAFSGTDLDRKLRERNVTQLCLSGVCTDICVLHTAIDAYNLGYNVAIYEKATASFDPKGHDFAMRHFKNVLGFNIL